MTFTNYDGGLGIDYTRAIPMLPDTYLTMLRVQLKDGACDTVMFDSGAKSFYELSTKSFSRLRTVSKALEVEGSGTGSPVVGSCGAGRQIAEVSGSHPSIQVGQLPL